MATERVAAALIAGLLLGACTPTATETQQVALSHPPYRQDIVPQWVKLDWPPNNGCEAAARSETLAAGTPIDRFGDEAGSYFSRKGVSFGRRALPYVCSQTAYTVYRVMKPLHVSSCEAVAWFGEPGGATQYRTDETASKLRAEGAIQIVPNDAPPPCGD